MYTVKRILKTCFGSSSGNYYKLYFSFKPKVCLCVIPKQKIWVKRLVSVEDIQVEDLIDVNDIYDKNDLFIEKG